MRSCIHVLAALLALAGSLDAAIIEVPTDYPTIQEAVDAAVNGDDILVLPGTYTSGGPYVVDMLGKEVTLRSTNGPSFTFIDGFGKVAGINCSSGETNLTVIDGFTIRNCFNNKGGCMRISGGSSPTVQDCAFLTGVATLTGGAVWCSGSGSNPLFTNCQFNFNEATGSTGTGGAVSLESGCQPTFITCTIEGNTSRRAGGGVYSAQANPIFDDCTVSNNESLQSSGGGLYIRECEDFTVQGCTVSNNLTSTGSGAGMVVRSAQGNINATTIAANSSLTVGGGLMIDGSPPLDPWFPTVTECTISANDSAATGGGIYITQAGGNFINNIISNNIATDGGGVEIVGDNANPSFIDCSIWNNVATGSGGGINCNASSAATITNCTIRLNTAERGAGINNTNTSSVLATGTDITLNEASVLGGGISCDRGAEGTFNLCDITLNTAPLGAAIFTASDNATFNGVNVKLNTAEDTGGGIWIFNSSPLLTDCVFELNSSDGSGGGMACTEGASPFLQNCSMILNQAADAGGGLFCLSSSPEFSNCAIDNNTATLGGGILVDNSTPRFDVCDISNNQAEQGGGVSSTFSITIYEGCVFADNVATDAASGGGGMLLGNSHPAINECIFSGNQATAGAGGGILCLNADPVITTTTFDGNSADAAGGGGMMIAQGSEPSITESTLFERNTALFGAGIASITESAPSLTTCTIVNNNATADGGGLYCEEAFAVLNQCSLVGNNAVNGAAIHSLNAAPDLYGCSIVENNATGGNGGGMNLITSAVSLASCQFLGNSADRPGGGMSLDGSQAYIQESLFDSNFGTAGGGLRAEGSSVVLFNSQFLNNNATVNNGGGLFMNNSNASATNCTFGFNQTNATIRDGGGIACVAGDLAMLNCNVTGNVATAWGGGLYLNDSTSSILDSSFISNQATDASSRGGGIACDASSPTILNCNVSGNISVGKGGGISCISDSEPLISDTFIKDNEAQDFGIGSQGGGAGFVQNAIPDTSVILLNFATVCDNQPAGGAQPQIGTSDPLENSGFLNLGGDDPSEICLLSDRCPGDVNFDDVVDVNDVLGLIQVWGTNDFGGDLDGSGLVDVNDILRLIEFYGQPCPE
ncbi:MAG: right-handed parallel beta-helix repeat-containing protein [Phycisphaerales bacterium]|nr:right-handed parallel beta-helix repeat-containing protein [Phycisphaerales bacterium]